MLRAAILGCFAISLVSPSSSAQELRAPALRCGVRRGVVEQVDHLAQLVKVRFDPGRDARYFFIDKNARIWLDGKPSGLVYLKERMGIDVHVLQIEDIVIRLVAYYQSNPPPLARVTPGPFEDTDKVVKFYPHPDPDMKFAVGENLRMAIPKFHFVPLARSEADMTATWDKFQKSVDDPAFNISETWPIAIVPLGTKAKVLRVADGMYEVEVSGGRYDHWHLNMKKEWAYPADEAQAAKKAEELAASRPAKTQPATKADTPIRTQSDEDERRAKEADESSARQKLSQAQTLLRRNQREQAIEKLERLVIEHPGTKSAAEARRLLKDLKK
jgi:hypothetical protein